MNKLTAILNFRADLEVLNNVEVLKKELNIKNNSELFRFLIKQEITKLEEEM